MSLDDIRNRIGRFKAILQHQGPRAAAHRLTRWIWSHFERGPGSLRHHYEQVRRTDERFDAETGMDTGGVLALYNLTVASANRAFGNAYQATDPEHFSAAIASLDLPLDESTFIDLGSGKGRALLLAARHPFKRIVGIEFAEELHRAAAANLELMGNESRIELIHGDATEYSLPQGPVVLYLYNPFDRPLMTAVATNAVANWAADPRPVRVIYAAPFLADCWSAAGWRVAAAHPHFVIFSPPTE